MKNNEPQIGSPFVASLNAVGWIFEIWTEFARNVNLKMSSFATRRTQLQSYFEVALRQIAAVVVGDVQYEIVAPSEHLTGLQVVLDSIDHDIVGEGRFLPSDIDLLERSDNVEVARAEVRMRHRTVGERRGTSVASVRTEQTSASALNNLLHLAGQAIVAGPAQRQPVEDDRRRHAVLHHSWHFSLEAQRSLPHVHAGHRSDELRLVRCFRHRVAERDPCAEK